MPLSTVGFEPTPFRTNTLDHSAKQPEVWQPSTLVEGVTNTATSLLYNFALHFVPTLWGQIESQWIIKYDLQTAQLDQETIYMFIKLWPIGGSNPWPSRY